MVSIARILWVLLLVAGCAANQPIVYPNAHVQQMGPYRVQQDVDQCQYMANQYVHNNPELEVAKKTAWGAAGGAAIGAVGGAIAGNAGRGAAIGAATGATAGLMHGAYRASEGNPVWKNFVEQCLREKGYQVIGWQ